MKALTFAVLSLPAFTGQNKFEQSGRVFASQSEDVVTIHNVPTLGELYLPYVLIVALGEYPHNKTTSILNFRLFKRLVASKAYCTCWFIRRMEGRGVSSCISDPTFYHTKFASCLKPIY